MFSLRNKKNSSELILNTPSYPELWTEFIPFDRSCLKNGTQYSLSVADRLVGYLDPRPSTP